MRETVVPVNQTTSEGSSITRSSLVFLFAHIPSFLLKDGRFKKLNLSRWEGLHLYEGVDGPLTYHRHTHTHICTLLDEPWDVLLFHSSSTCLTHLCLCCHVVTATKKGSEWDTPLMSQIKYHSSPCISLAFCFCPTHTPTCAPKSWHGSLLGAQQ